ncbi:porin family protein [Flavobacterium sp. TSSA_36]|uniref:porin family protein n=1 Tax=Flavobacterium sp. TSSA_36 TaxID=3447669 RepID=UPI003F3F55BE
MKKMIIVAAFALLGSWNTQAQLLHFGAKAGINYANLTGSEIIVNKENYKSEAISSYHIGLLAEIKLTEKFGVQPELLYSTQGASYKNAIKEFTNELGYLSIPVMAKIYLNNTFSLELGPQASFLLSEKKNVDFEDSKTFDFAIAGGLGVKITKSIFVQGRYGLGLTEVSTNAKAKNSVVQVSAGFMF